jgi:hypothetical protein
MTKKSFILVFALLMVLAFAPMALAGDVDIGYEYRAYQTTYGTAYDIILPAPDELGTLRLTGFASIQTTPYPILAPVYTDQGAIEYVLVSSSELNASGTLNWFFPWDVEVQIGDVVLVPLETGFVPSYRGHETVVQNGESYEPYLVRNLVPRNFLISEILQRHVNIPPRE